MYTKLIVSQEDDCVFPLLKKVRLEGVFFHGDHLPFSLDATDSDLVFTQHVLNLDLGEGCHTVSINYQGYVYVNYRLYFWYDRRGHQHGLIVNPLDKEATAQARRCLKKRVSNL